MRSSRVTGLIVLFLTRCLFCTHLQSKGTLYICIFWYEWRNQPLAFLHVVYFFSLSSITFKLPFFSVLLPIRIISDLKGSTRLTRSLLWICLSLLYFLLRSLFCILFSFHLFSVNLLHLQLTLFLQCSAGWVMFILVAVCSWDPSPLTSHPCLFSFLFPMPLQPPFISGSWCLSAAFCCCFVSHSPSFFFLFFLTSGFSLTLNAFVFSG